MVFFPGSLHERRHACRRYVGPEADAARREARATSGGAPVVGPAEAGPY